MNCLDLIKEVSEGIFNLQKDNGSFPAGHNGPHNDPDTPVRNTAHILILLSYYYQFTGNIRFKDSISRAADFLCSKEARPFGYSFHHRKNISKKDKCNGLIGQAWTFEALVQASNVLEDEKYIELAEEVFLQHAFDDELCLWGVIEIDGTPMGIDKTFNHQLWFAATALMIFRHKDIENLPNGLTEFINVLYQKFELYKNGLIRHPINFSEEEKQRDGIKKKSSLKRRVRSVIKKCSLNILNNSTAMGSVEDERMIRAVGYHSFNLCGFALLKQQIPGFGLWDSDKLKRSVDYIFKEEYINDLDKNKYGFSYNSPGFEIPFSIYNLCDLDKEQFLEFSRPWINKQVSRCYNSETGMMDRNTTDPKTLTARTYELCRLPADILDKIYIDFNIL